MADLLESRASTLDPFARRPQPFEPPRPLPSAWLQRAEGGEGRPGPFVRARTGICGVATWALEPLRGRFGTPGASWCPHAARAEAEARSGPRGPLDGTESRLTPSLDEVVAAWRRARKGRGDVWSLSPRDELFGGMGGASAPRWPHGLELLDVMLREGAHVVLTTRAGLAEGEGLVALAARHRGRLSVRLGLFGASPEAEARWEPGLATRGDRLALAKRLVEVGADAAVELGPVVPFVNDDARHWQGVLRAVARVGVTRVVPRLITGDWALIHRLERILSPAEGRMVMGWLGLGRRATTRAGEGEPAAGSAGFGLSERIRSARLGLLRESVGNLPVRLALCGCLTSGTRATACDHGVTLAAPPRAEAVQGDLFGGLTRR